MTARIGTFWWRAAAIIAALPACAARAQAQPASAAGADAAGQVQVPEGRTPSEIEGLGVDERVGLMLPLELQFTDSKGKQVSLGDYFKDDQKPAIILLGYYRCPVVCGVLREKLAQSMSALDYTAGQEYRLLVFSFDPGETFDAAEKYRLTDLATYGRDLTAEQDLGVAYHVGDPTSVRRMADALGYRYKRLGNGEYSHPVAIAVATPQGKLSRYLYGFSQEPRDLRLALMEASQGKLVRTVGDRLLAFCYMYDPQRGAYTLQAVRVMQVGGLITLLAVGGLVGVMLLSERLKRRKRGGGGGGGGGKGGEGATKVSDSAGATIVVSGAGMAV